MHAPDLPSGAKYFLDRVASGRERPGEAGTVRVGALDAYQLHAASVLQCLYEFVVTMFICRECLGEKHATVSSQDSQGVRIGVCVNTSDQVRRFQRTWRNQDGSSLKQ